MPEKKFQELEIEVKQLIKISQQLKDVNEDLFQKNSSLLEENKNLFKKANTHMIFDNLLQHIYRILLSVLPLF